MDLVNIQQCDFNLIHEVLVGGEWSPVEIGTFWQDYDPSQPSGPGTYHPITGRYMNTNRKGMSGWREFNCGAVILVMSDVIKGTKTGTIRGRLEGKP